jgi:hypothetical protein
MKQAMTINDTTVTFRPLTIKEIYNADLTPPDDPDQWPLYLAFESEYPLILLSADCEPSLLLDAVETDVQEAFRKANPFMLKPLQVALREQKNKTLASLFSGQFAGLSGLAMPEPGTTP